jgi:hypothetical protein
VVDLFEQASLLQEFLASRNWRFCFIGGVAVQVWGEPRLTRDLDLSLMTGFGQESQYVDALLAEFPARIRDAREFALTRRTLLLQTQAGISVDVSLAALPFEDEMMDRAKEIEVLPGRWLRICSAEDLVTMKVFAGREIDSRDARTVVVRQQRLDWDYIFRHLQWLEEMLSTTGLTDRARRLQEFL